MPIAESDREGPRPKDRTTRRRNAVVCEDTTVRLMLPRLSVDKTRGSSVLSFAKFRSKSVRRGVAVTAIFQAPKKSLPVFLAPSLDFLDDSADSAAAARTSSKRFRALDKRSRGTVVVPDTGLADDVGMDSITGAIDAAKPLSFVGW